MVRLVHDQQVPLTFNGLGQALRVLLEQLQAAQHQLLRMERVVPLARLLDRAAALLVEDAESQVEAAQQLHQPLMHQRIGHQDQHPVGASGEQLVMQDQTGLDGLAQADLVRQQHPGGGPIGHFMGDIELVGDQIDASAGQPQKGGLFQATQVLQGLIAQVEPVQGIDLAGQQPVLGFVEADEIAQLALIQASLAAVAAPAPVGEQAGLLPGARNLHPPAFVTFDLVALAEDHPGQGSILHGVDAGFARGHEEQGDGASFYLEDGAETQFRLGVTDPTLAGDETAHGRYLKNVGHDNDFKTDWPDLGRRRRGKISVSEWARGIRVSFPCSTQATNRVWTACNGWCKSNFPGMPLSNVKLYCNDICLGRVNFNSW